MDARLFFDLAVERGFDAPALLLGEGATRDAVRAKLVEMASLSEPGDLFLLTFSGHGGRTCVRAPDGALEEVGTWQLYDGTLNDWQLKSDLAHFREGVRVVVISDSCGGGMPNRRSPQSRSPQSRSPQSPGGSEAIGLSRPAIEGFLNASVLVLAACQEAKYADGNGLPGHFANAIKRTLNGIVFDGPYSAFHQALCNAMPAYQQPDYYALGIANPTFEAQQPFTI
jgi:hypothetical protein